MKPLIIRDTNKLREIIFMTMKLRTELGFFVVPPQKMSCPIQVRRQMNAVVLDVHKRRKKDLGQVCSNAVAFVPYLLLI